MKPDFQVTAKSNLSSIKRALTKGGNSTLKTIELDRLNHLFRHCKTGSSTEYEQIEETFLPEVLKIIQN
ncbi:MAG: hypothetical protein R2757_04440 [Draconibacterium sp.]